MFSLKDSFKYTLETLHHITTKAWETKDFIPYETLNLVS